jgi:hypothetical protein
MTRTGARKIGCFIFAVAAAFVEMAGAKSTAAEPRTLERETREFKVSVDGKGRGKCTIEISRREDGSDRMQIAAALSFNYVVYEYRYSSAGSEVWKDGRLVRLENTADFNGTKYVVKAKADQKEVRVTVNGQSSQVEADVWVTSYWRLPDRLAQIEPAGGSGIVPAGGGRRARQGGAVPVALLDSDKGQRLKGEIRRIGDETITVAGQKLTCTHFKIGGDVKVDVWYDGDLRLVRQETVESGHRTLMELTRLAVE